MLNFDNLVLLLAENYTIQLNTNIFETGLINIIILIGILIYIGKDFISSVLETRKNMILENIQEAETRVKEANKRLVEAQKQFDQLELLITKIQNETKLTKLSLLELELTTSQKEINIRFNRALATFNSKKQQIFLEIKDQIINLILNQTSKRIQTNYQSKEFSLNFITETINNLNVDLL